MRIDENHYLLADETPEGANPADTGFIDLLFQIIFFLLIGMNDYQPMAGIGAKVPETAAGQPVEPSKREVITLSCDRKGGLYLQGKRASPRAITKTLGMAKGRFPNALIVVEGDRGAQYGWPFALLECVQQAGFKEVTLETTAPREPPNAALAQ